MECKRLPLRHLVRSACSNAKWCERESLPARSPGHFSFLPETCPAQFGAVLVQRPGQSTPRSWNHAKKHRALLHQCQFLPISLANFNLSLRAQRTTPALWTRHDSWLTKAGLLGLMSLHPGSHNLAGVYLPSQSRTQGAPAQTEDAGSMIVALHSELINLRYGGGCCLAFANRFGSLDYN